MTKRATTRRTRNADAPLRVVFYLRVSTREQADSGAGLAAQETSLRAEADRRGWEVAEVIVDTGSGKSLAKRPGITHALELLAAGEVDALAVAKLDRLSRSVLDFAGLMARAQSEGWGLIALDVNVDTTTPAGKLVANVMAAVAEWEREVISARTRDGLAERRAAGVRLGRPRQLPLEIVRRIVAERATGATLRGIAAGLTADGIPTAQGKTWGHGTIAAVLRSQDAAA